MWFSVQVEAELAAPREMCGVIVEDNGEDRFILCENVSEQEDTFRIDPKEFVRLQLLHKVKGIVHSHPDGDFLPSKTDFTLCNLINLDYYIVNLTGGVFHLKPLKGREYVWGKFDCFTLVSDYYRQELGVEFKRGDWIEDWWEHGYDYFSTIPQECGFMEVTDGSMNKNDLLLFKVGAKVPDHCGVYTGGGKFLHHAINRLSCEDPLTGLWRKTKVKVLRYED